MIDFKNFPTKDISNPDVLYNYLGSFWTNLFSEKETLRAYTTGLSESVIQHYYDVLDHVSSYSLERIPLFDRERWKPIVVNRSDFNKAPFVFEENGAVFGPQLESDIYYHDVTFQFGFPKIPVANVYAVDVDDGLRDFSVMATSIVNPDKLFLHGVDVILKDGVIFFNSNIFEDDSVPKLPVLDGYGARKTFMEGGLELPDQQIILWIYNSNTDTDNLYNNYGHIFDLRLGSTDYYRNILKQMFNIHVEGPTVSNIVNVCCSFIGISTAREDETIEDIFESEGFKFVVTDRNTYRFPAYSVLLFDRFDTLKKDDIITDAIEYYDDISYRGWWRNKIVNQIGLDKTLFIGNYRHSIVVRNELELLVVDANGDFDFPIHGTDEDIAEFHSNMDKEQIKNILGLSNGQSILVNPLDFVFENYLKSNTAYIRFTLSEEEKITTSAFFSLLSSIQHLLPKHVYFVFDVSSTLPFDEYSVNRPTSVSFDSGNQVLNGDGSNANGEMESLAPYFFADVSNRLFSIGYAPALDNLEVELNSDSSVDANVREGSLLVAIPEGRSFKEVNNLLFMDFS